MSMKRITKSATDWAKVQKFTGEYKSQSFKKLKAASETYIRKVQENPEAPPAIDWNALKATVSNKDIVDKLEASYKQALAKIPYPDDTLAATIEKMEKESIESAKQMVSFYEERNDECRQMIAKFEKMWPIEWHTVETFAMTFPDWADWYGDSHVKGLYPPTTPKDVIAEETKPTRLDLEARF
ncbi:ATP synthase subunit d, mitochondrial-like [Panonychus citri]|uniref:ATP synthase subunit d, mitochondrial-like n=1 Tax=Panonychus citri TaxID=50023 RepID=UPI00230711D7|nr:ATP synthase subunit d, mitochondrial-like [Panonychus citri]